MVQAARCESRHPATSHCKPTAVSYNSRTQILLPRIKSPFRRAPTRILISPVDWWGIGNSSPAHELDIGIGTAATAKTSAFSTLNIANTATSTTASINKTGLQISSTGTWNGASANNIGLYVSSVTGGTNNYDAIFNGGGNVGIGTTTPERCATSLFSTRARFGGGERWQYSYYGHDGAGNRTGRCAYVRWTIRHRQRIQLDMGKNRFTQGRFDQRKQRR